MDVVSSFCWAVLVSFANATFASSVSFSFGWNITVHLHTSRQIRLRPLQQLVGRRFMNFTIRYSRLMSVQRLAHGKETKNKEKQKPSSSEETVQAIVRGGSPGKRSETMVGKICKTGKFSAGSGYRWLVMRIGYKSEQRPIGILTEHGRWTICNSWFGYEV